MPAHRITAMTFTNKAAREMGGLGIFLVREMMDDVAYTYVNKENRLTIKKKYLQPTDEPVS
jgi:anti-sigma regulatory factor (Ser/Thr protein kinase)